MGKAYFTYVLKLKNIFDSVRKPFYKAHDQKADKNMYFTAREEHYKSMLHPLKVSLETNTET